MKRLFAARIFFCIVLCFVVGSYSADATIKNWINTSGGNWFDPLNWSPNGVPQAGDSVTITNNGTYTVLVSTGLVSTTVFTIGGASGKQTLIYGSTAGFANLFVTNTTIQANGVLAVTNWGIYGALTVKSGGELVLEGFGNFNIYGLAVTNQGTVTCTNGSIGTDNTFITNTGLWQITGTGSLNHGGSNPDRFYNAGILRKAIDPGSVLFNMDLINLPSGNVDVLAGTLVLAPATSNALSSSFTVTSPAVLQLTGIETDAGAIMSGSGSFLFTSGTFNLLTNTIANLKFIGGDIYVIGTTTFQQGGAITNLTLDGAGVTLRGTNRVAGTVTINNGNLSDTLTVLPGGQLVFANTNAAFLSPFKLVNQGTINWSGSSLQAGTTSISNGGVWTITGDTSLSYGGVGTTVFTNAGTIQKTGGTGVTFFSGFPFVNLPSGIIRAASGTIQMPTLYTNAAGEIQLAGGTVTAGINIGMIGGTLDGVGTVGAGTPNSPAIFDGGTVSPGTGAGLIRFASGLTLGTNVILSLDGTGTVPGVTYDQLSVTGAVAISNCTLQVTSLPSVPIGTTFVIITNTTANPTVGNFNGLPENSPLTISGQPFRIHYSGGNGNDVVLVRDSGTGVGPQLSSGGYTNKTFKFLGAGSTATIYTIQASTNFLQWTNVGMATGDVSGNFLFTDTNATNFRYRFYRTTN
ncbi:MAG TPA: hypothetical protein VHC44_05695 [Verrucomicrobiae bacterium]|nr:hypothetical protein [Verrucomicrobiae bacterium]